MIALVIFGIAMCLLTFCHDSVLVVMSACVIASLRSLVKSSLHSFVVVLDQYCSFNKPDSLGKIDTAGGLVLARTQGVVTHLSLDTVWVDPRTTGNDALLKNFVEDHFVEGFSLPRGE